jgi:signal transduction histidine kinase
MENVERLRMNAIRLRPLVDQAMVMVAPLVEARAHQLVSDVPNDIPAVQGDPRAVLRVLVNLLSNAVKFTAPQGMIRITATAERNRVRMAVSDSGIGVAAEDQERIFNYFEQVHRSGQEQALGAGIGLAICRDLVRRMGGEIGVVSAPGQGSSFFFTLPYPDPGSLADLDIDPGSVRS